MKNCIKFLSLFLILYSIELIAQNKSVPYVELLTLEGKSIKASEISNDGMPMIMFFFKTNDNESFNQLKEVNEFYGSGQISQKIKIVGICIDCTGQTQYVKHFVNGHNVNLEIYIDKNGDFKRAMSVSSVPYSIRFDRDKKLCVGGLGIVSMILKPFQMDAKGMF